MYHTLYSVFESRVKANPNKIAIIENEKSLTYIQLHEHVNRLADSMYKKGIKKGTKLAFLITNSIEYIELFLVCHRLGIVAVLFNYNLSPGEIAHNLKISESNAVILPTDYSMFEAPVEDIGIPKSRCFMLGNGDSDLVGINSLIEQGNPEFSYTENIEPDDDAVYIFTGGTTGEPKAAVHTYHSLFMNTFLHHFGVNPYLETDIFLNYAPLYHWGGFSILLNILTVGATFIILKRFVAEEVFKQITENKATHIFLLPVTVAADLKKIPHFNIEDMKSVRRVNVGGTTGVKDHILELFDIFPNAKVNIGYGMTENACSIVQVLTKEEILEHPEYLKSVGKPSLECDVKLLNKDGKEVAQGEVGEVYATSLAQFKGYLGKASPFVNGYFPTGDLFRQDEQGNYYFVDRSKNMIRSGGENIYSVEVERTIELHEFVEECAVVGIPHERYEETVAAAIKLKAGKTLTENEIVNFCKKNLAHYKHPRKLHFYEDDLPRTALGKIDKKKIRENFIKELTF